MPRHARIKSESGIYHIMLRGTDKQNIFNDEQDYKKFIEILYECKIISKFELYAYCLMGNHIHLLIKEKDEGIDLIVKRICCRFVSWYNYKYYRTGHLFQDRFKSEPVNSDEYFLTVLRYIHQNPVKAGLCFNIADYQYSSANAYINNIEDKIDFEFVHSIIDKEYIIDFFNEKNSDICLDYDEKAKYINDIDAKNYIYEISKCNDTESFLVLSNEKQKEYVALMKDYGMSIRQISRLTGLSFGLVRKY